MSLGKSLEDYLEAILVLQNTNTVVRCVDLAEYMNFTKASISHAVKELKKKELIYTDRKGFLHLTDEGRKIAVTIYARHCFFTEQLIKVGVEPEIAEREACQMEHVISEDSFQKLKAAVSNTKSEKKGNDL